MSRLHLPFACGSCALAGTLDTAPGSAGLLIVTGGNELRSGAFSGQAELAASIAKAGFPVFRYDRRGIGDSEGENRGFRKSSKDIAAALEAFRAMAPSLNRVIALGNCDAASALMLAGGAGCDGLILSNPWTIEESDHGDASGSSDGSNLSSGAIRSRYLEKLRNPSEIWRLLRGGVDLRKLAGGLAAGMRTDPSDNTLAREIGAGIDGFTGPISILLASADRTAQEFERHWDKKDPRIQRCEGASHAYVEPHAREWFKAEVLKALRAH
ncbi:MAG: hydrolase 1, exosortase A system-associated [Marinomonas sp.]